LSELTERLDTESRGLPLSDETTRLYTPRFDVTPEYAVNEDTSIRFVEKEFTKAVPHGWVAVPKAYGMDGIRFPWIMVEPPRPARELTMSCSVCAWNMKAL
jgi:hypothetical protein